MLPFVEAVEKMKDFYKLKRLDIFKDGVSLPGLVLKYLIKSTDSEFYLFDDEDKITKEDRKRNNLFYLLKDSIVGGVLVDQVLYLIDIMKQIKHILED